MSRTQYGVLLGSCIIAAFAGGVGVPTFFPATPPARAMQQERVIVNPPGTEEIYRTRQFAQAVRVGDILWVSGQVGRDRNGRVAEDVETQCRLAFERLRDVLTAAGGSLDDVVEIVTFHTSMDDFPVFRRVKAEFLTGDYPAWTAVGVPELALPEFRIEIKATAVIGSGQ